MRWQSEKFTIGMGPLIKKIKQLLADIRHDTDAQFELRQLFFGAVIAAGVTYAFFALYVEGEEKKQTKMRARKSELVKSLGQGEIAALTSVRLQKLQEEKEMLEEKTAQLIFQEKILREQYSAESSSESFANVIFTHLPLSPIDLENGFVQMNVLEPQVFDFFNVSPINLQGNIDYGDFLHYLQYLESRPEVGMIGNISLGLLLTELSSPRGQVHFDVVVGRIQLH